MLMFMMTHKSSCWPLWSDVSLRALRTLRSLGDRQREREREREKKRGRAVTLNL